MPPRSAANLQFLIAAAVLLAALVLGGGQGTLGDSSVQLLALGLVGVSLWRHVAEEAARLPRIAWLALLPCTLPLLQLLPIPESLWLLPEARQALATELAAAPVDSAQRWSLVPLATERALVWLLPAIALYLSALQLDAGRRKALVGVLVAMAAVNVVLGLAQVAGGTDSALRFYTITNPTEAVGFFANRNHLASLLVIALPFVVVGDDGGWLIDDFGFGSLLENLPDLDIPEVPDLSDLPDDPFSDLPEDPFSDLPTDLFSDFPTDLFSDFPTDLFSDFPTDFDPEDFLSDFPTDLFSDFPTE